MFYIKLTSDRTLMITQSDTLYRGDNLNQKLVFLIPNTVGDIDMLTAKVYFNYIRADGVADVVLLERAGSYNDTYLQYRVPVSCKLTRCAGQCVTWLHIFAGSPADPTIAKSGECVLMVQDSKNMDDYLCDHALTALYQMSQDIENIEKPPSAGLTVTDDGAGNLILG